MIDSVRKTHLIVAAVIILVSGCIYGRTLGFAFLPSWDDSVYITGNGAIKGFSPANLAAAFSSFHAGNYAPVQTLSYLLDYMLWGLNPAGYHLANVVYHTLSAIVFFLLLRRLGCSVFAAGAGALLFLVHPLQVESVAWVSERKNLLAGLFLLLTLHCWIPRRGAPESATGLRLLSLVPFLLALLAKGAIAIVFPLVLAAYVLSFPTKLPLKRLALLLVPHLLLSLVFAAVAIYAQSAELSGGRLAQQPGVWLFTMPPVFARYLEHLLWPVDLLPSYLPVYRQHIDAAVLLSLLLVLLLGILAYMRIRKDRRILFWIVCTLAPLLPVAQLIPFVAQMNDRYLYLPLLGIGGLVAVGIDRVATLERPAVRTALRAGVAGLLLSLALLSFRQTAIWKTDVDLWTYLIAHSPPTALYQWRLGEAYRFAGEPLPALAAYQQALALNPGNLRAHRGMAETLLQQGNGEQAIPHALAIIRTLPRLSLGFTLLGEAYLLTGERDKAAAALSRARQLDPADRRTATDLERLGP